VLRLLRVEAAGFSQVFDLEIQMGLQLAGCIRIMVDVFTESSLNRFRVHARSADEDGRVDFEWGGDWSRGPNSHLESRVLRN
jgi:hypothetical protein